MADAPEAGRLPVLATAGEAYRVTLLNLTALLRLAWAWLLGLTALVGLTSAFFWPSHAAALDAGAPTSWVQVLTTCMTMAAGASIAVAWHRLLLRGEAPGPTPYLRRDGVVGRYLFAGLVMLSPFVLSAFLAPAGETTEAEAGQALPRSILSVSMLLYRWPSGSARCCPLSLSRKVM